MKQFFQDNTGQLSFMRLSCFISLLVAIVLTVYGVLYEKQVFEFVLTYLVACFAPKSVQKFAETGVIKNPLKNSTEQK